MTTSAPARLQDFLTSTLPLWQAQAEELNTCQSWMTLYDRLVGVQQLIDRPSNEADQIAALLASTLRQAVEAPYKD